MNFAPYSYQEASPRVYTVYKHTGPTGKVYIGITKRKPSERWRNGDGYSHSPHFYAAINRYGWDSFRHEILAESLTQSEAEEMEVALIEQHRATDPHYGYNADRGGSTGPKHSEQTRAKIADANRARKWSETSRAKIRVSRAGSTASARTREKMSRAQRGRKHTAETIDKIRNAQPTAPVRDVTSGQSYRSVQAAAAATGCDPSKIVAVCRGKRNSTGGRVWEYEGATP